MPPDATVFRGPCPCGRTTVTVTLVRPPGRTRPITSCTFTCPVCTPHWMLHRQTIARKTDLLCLHALQTRKLLLGKQRLAVLREAIDAWLMQKRATTIEQEYQVLLEATLWHLTKATFLAKRARVARAADLPLDYEAQVFGQIVVASGKGDALQRVDQDIARLARELRAARGAIAFLRLAPGATAGTAPDHGSSTTPRGQARSTPEFGGRG